MPKAVFLDLDTVSRDDIDLASLNATPYEWQIHKSTNPGEATGRIRDAELVISNKVVLDSSALEQATALKLICIAATGTNNVDLEKARELGIAVTNVAGYSTPSVVQHVFALILSLTTRLPDYQHALHNGAWQRSEQFCLLDFPIRELQGKTMGIVGYGALGSAVAGIARAFGMEILIAQRPGGEPAEGRLPLHELLPRCDILSLHCPLTGHTADLIGSAELALMKPDALLINTARGGMVDESALASALRAGELGGAGIDVLAVEPPREGNPLLEPGTPNLIVTPHTAWASRESRQRLIDEVAANIQAFQEGEERNRVA
ncbi:MAG: 2-hydroxyacid dehydrogenase [Candidatus Sedimenticola sp. 6PFRAG7]